MAEPFGPNTDPTARLREEYLALLKDNFLELPYAVQSADADPRQRNTVLPTAGEYERLTSLYRDGALPQAQAARSLQIWQATFDQLRQQVGPPGSPISAERLAHYEQQHRKEIASGTDFGLIGFIHWLSRQVEIDLAQLRLKLPCPVFVGEYPTGDFNAWSSASSSGGLVLINRGLCVFIYLMAKLFALSVHYNSPRPGDIAVKLDENGIVVPNDAPYTKNAIIDCAIDALMSYLLLRQPTKARQLPALGSPYGLVAAILATQAEKFVLAHEYGHVVAGHVTPNRNVPQPAVGQGVRLVEFSHAEEFEADALAAAVMVTRDATAQDIGGGELGWYQAVAAGPAFFFALSDMIRRYEEAGGAKPLTDHPPPAERWKLLRPGFALSSGPAVLSLAEGCIRWTGALIPEMHRRMTELSHSSPQAQPAR